MCGSAKHIVTSISTINVAPNRSFIEKNGWKGILSLSLCVPSGLFDPVWCRNIKCTTTIAANTKGNKK